MEDCASYVLMVEDDRDVRESTARMLELEGFPACRGAESAAEAEGMAAEAEPLAVLLDLGLPDLPGEELLSRLRDACPAAPVIVVTARAELETALACVRAGAFDYVVKGSDPRRLLTSLRRALELRARRDELSLLGEGLKRPGLRSPAAFAAIETRSPRMLALLRFVEAVAPSAEPLLVTGETGTGKELVAAALHAASGRKGPFLALNLGGLDEHMFSDTLFGHLRGAYTGAEESRKGLVAAAAGGTLFLDEIGEIAPQAQVRLLRFLENGEYFPLGSDAPRRSEARIVAATNRDLRALAAEGRFRRDLLYRLSAFCVEIPPLRERPEDVEPIARRFLRESAGGAPPLEPDLEAWESLRSLPLAGNARELRTILLRASLFAREGRLAADAIREAAGSSGAPAPASIQGASSAASGAASADPPGDASAAPVRTDPSRGLLFPEPLPTIKETIAALVDEAMTRSGGNQRAAARLLGISPQALSQRLRNRGRHDETAEDL